MPKDDDARTKRKAAFELAKLKAENARLQERVVALLAQVPDRRRANCLAARDFCEPSWAYPYCQGHTQGSPNCDGDG